MLALVGSGTFGDLRKPVAESAAIVFTSEYALCVSRSARTINDLIAPFNIFPSNHMKLEGNTSIARFDMFPLNHDVGGYYNLFMGCQ